MHVLNKRPQGIWKPQGHIKFIDLGKEFHILQCTSLEDYSKVLFEGPWCIGENFLYVRRWVPNVTPSQAKIDTISIWVCLYDLPIEYFDNNSLTFIARQIGTPLRIGQISTNVERDRFAHTRVSIDFNKPLPQVIWFNSFAQEVVYKNPPRLCLN